MARIVDLFNTQASQKIKCALETKSSVNNLQYKVLKNIRSVNSKRRGLRGLSDGEVRQTAQIEIMVKVKVNDNITTLHGLNSKLETQTYTKSPINIPWIYNLQLMYFYIYWKIPLHNISTLLLGCESRSLKKLVWTYRMLIQHLGNMPYFSSFLDSKHVSPAHQLLLSS